MRKECKSVHFFNQFLGSELIYDLVGDLSTNFKKATIGIWRSHMEYDIIEIYYAVKGKETNDDTLSEIIGSRSNRKLSDIKKLYRELIKEDLEVSIKR